MANGLMQPLGMRIAIIENGFSGSEGNRNRN
jgi:hypothetical protein